MTSSFPRLLFCCLLGTSLSAQAVAVPDDSVQQISVRALRNPVTLPYAPFYAAAAAFEQQHWHAPQARLRFQVTLTHAGVDAKDKTLRLIGDTIDIAIPFDANGEFELPISAPALSDRAVLELNRKAGPTKVGFSVNDPGEPGWTMGKARLMCQVLHAYLQSDMLFAAMHETGARCASFDYRVGVNTGSVVLQDGSRRAELRASAAIVTFPTGDQSWPDQTRLTFLDTSGVPAVTQ